MLREERERLIDKCPDPLEEPRYRNGPYNLKELSQIGKLLGTQFYFYTDGSFNKSKKLVGSGTVLLVMHPERPTVPDSIHVAWDGFDDPELAKMYQVGGEINAAANAVWFAGCCGVYSKVFYDYLGVENWATGKWQRKNGFTQNYHQIMSQSFPDWVGFHKVEAHTGDVFNEVADLLAKYACKQITSIQLTSMLRSRYKLVITDEVFEHEVTGTKWYTLCTVDEVQNL